MSNNRPESHSYRQWEGTPQWAVLDQALTKLVENRELFESARHEYVVGYLCEALATQGPVAGESSVSRQSAEQSSREALQRAQELMRPYRQPGRSLVDELISERHAEAERE